MMLGSKPDKLDQTSGRFQPRLCENADGSDRGRRLISQPGAFEPFEAIIRLVMRLQTARHGRLFCGGAEYPRSHTGCLLADLVPTRQIPSWGALPGAVSCALYRSGTIAEIKIFRMCCFCTDIFVSKCGGMR